MTFLSKGIRAAKFIKRVGLKTLVVFIRPFSDVNRDVNRFIATQSKVLGFRYGCA